VTGVVITVDDAEVRAAFANLARAAGDLTPVMADIGAQLVTHVGLRFEAGAGPGNVPWKQSRRAAEQDGRTLVDTARLKQSITFRASATGVDVGTNVQYAAIHQFGGTIRAKTSKGLRFRLPWLRSKTDSGWRTLQSVTLPARPFLGFDEEDREATTAIIAAHLARATSGGATA
jgi:phage virion morphogenesis protein